MFKRIFLFLAMNIAVIVLVTIVIAILENVFWIVVTPQGSYTWLLIFAALFWFAWSFISLAMSKWMAKRAYGVKVFSKEEAHNLSGKEKVVYTIVEELAERNRIKIPEVWIYNSTDPNAFATWASKNSSLVAVSTWLLDQMSKDEIEGVIGHEMAHILNGDMVTMSLLQWVLNTFVIFFARIAATAVQNFITKWEGNNNWFVYYWIVILFEIVFWILASMIAMWFSRHREYRADEWSAKFLWKEKMIKALEALKRMQNYASTDDSKMAAFKISTKKPTWFRAMFSSHPDLDLRIKNLEDLKM